MKSKYLIFFCMLALLTSKTTAQKTYNKNNRLHVSIRGRIKELKAGDSVKITLWRYGIKVPEMKTSVWVKAQNGSFPTVDFPLSFPAYLTVYMPGKDSLYLENYLVEPGDKILVSHEGSFIFSGKGYAKYQYRYTIDSLSWASSRRSHVPAPRSNEYYDYADSCTYEKLSILENYRAILTPLAYGILKSDIVSRNGINKMSSADLYIDNLDSISLRKALGIYQDHCHKFEDDSNFLRNDANSYALSFPDFLFRKIIIDSFFISNKKWDLLTLYHIVRSNFYGFFRERLLTSLITKYRNKGEIVSYCIQDARSLIKTREFTNVLSGLFRSGEKGVRAYPFRLPNSSGKYIRLTDFKGTVVLLHFWFTGCTPCRFIAPKLVEIENHFSGRPIKFISISIDRDKQDWIKSVQKGSYTSTGITNLYTAGLGEDHPLVLHYRIPGYPTLILIDKKGFVYSTRVPDPKIEGGIQELISLIEKVLAE